MNIFTLILNMIWLMLPAYLANPAAAVSAKINKFNTPMDFGKKVNGQRIFGDGKTYKGFFTGIIIGIIIGLVQNLINSSLLNNFMPIFTYKAIFALPFGSMIGDLTASFLKRRLAIERGAQFFPIDQLDFVFGSWLVTILVSPHWFTKNFTLPIILATLILTPIFHRIINIIGYKLGISRNPW